MNHQIGLNSLDSSSFHFPQVDVIDHNSSDLASPNQQLSQQPLFHQQYEDNSPQLQQSTNPSDISSWLSQPGSTAHVQQLYLRWQTLKSQLGEAAAAYNPEFLGLSKVLRSYFKQQEAYQMKPFRNSHVPAPSHDLNSNRPPGQLSNQLPGVPSQLPAQSPSQAAMQPANQYLGQVSTQYPGRGANPSTERYQANVSSQRQSQHHGQPQQQGHSFQGFNQSLPHPQQTMLSSGQSTPAEQGPTQPAFSAPNNHQDYTGGKSSPNDYHTPSNTATPSPAASQNCVNVRQPGTERGSGPAPSAKTPRSKPVKDTEASRRKESTQAREHLVHALGGLSEVATDPPEARQTHFNDYCNGNYKYMVNKMPYGCDVQSLKLLVEGRKMATLTSRLNYLLQKQATAEFSEDDMLELRKLNLINVQKALRGELVSNVYWFHSTFLDVENKSFFSRMWRPSMANSNFTEQMDQQQKIERKRRDNQKKMEYLSSLCKHSEAVHSSWRSQRDRNARRARAVASFHNYVEKEEQKRLERTAKQRLQALKMNDEEAYIKLLDQTKDTRITHLLRQTNQFLDSLTEAVRSQQRSASGMNPDGNRAVNDTQAQDDAADPDEAREKVDYYAVAHKIKEEVTKQPNILVGGTLKEYQVKGLQWMVSLFNNNLNGILADEMGLGKTIQTLSLIAYLIEVKKIPGPYLVIVPLSTLTNWTMEFERWAPSIKTVVYKGTPAARRNLTGIVRSHDFQVLLTTFEYIIRDRGVLGRIRWVHMIIDEGHRMKNTQSKLSYTLTQYYTSRYRLILTGTPLQNNLPELWALLNFVLPKIFNSVKSFDEWFNTPFANTGSQDKMDLSEEETLLIIRRLHKVLRPFLLRRLKKDVEKDLPDKVEKIVKCKMSALQIKLYEQMIVHRVLFLGEKAHGASSNGVKGLNNQIMQLRKICNHPFVFEEVEDLVNPDRVTNDNLWRSSGKFELLDRILPKFKSTGHRVLIFFQMTQIMDIMEDFLRLRGMQYLRLDGATKAEDRSELLKLFNAPNSPYFAFLLSTRAGGLGLNLQSADTVIIYDTDWNPHQDLQAQDRAHRIGQTREVRILRLITENSVEENILERAHRKLEIDGKVIQAGKFDNKSTSEEQEAFLRSLLEQDLVRREIKDSEEEELDDEELNEILARNDTERVVFRSIDKERALTSIYGKGIGQKDRLMTEDELPDVYKQDLKVHLQQTESTEVYGRGTRERKVTHYDDGLTEEQWLEAIDNDDDTLEDAIARKRARAMKRKGKPHNLVGSGYGDSSPDSGGSSPVNGSAHGSAFGGNLPKRRKGPGGGSKRVLDGSYQGQYDGSSNGVANNKLVSSLGVVGELAAAEATVAAVRSGPPRKRAKGRPPKINETLTREARQTLTEQTNMIMDYLQGIQDMNGRSRIDIFMEMPPKRYYPDYYQLITRPVACDLIHKRISTGYYQRLADFLADLKLMFSNARRYNEEGSVVCQDANALEQALEERVKEMEERERQHLMTMQPVNEEGIMLNNDMLNSTANSAVNVDADQAALNGLGLNNSGPSSQYGVEDRATRTGTSPDQMNNLEGSNNVYTGHSHRAEPDDRNGSDRITVNTTDPLQESANALDSACTFHSPIKHGHADSGSFQAVLEAHENLNPADHHHHDFSTNVLENANEKDDIGKGFIDSSFDDFGGF